MTWQALYDRVEPSRWASLEPYAVDLNGDGGLSTDESLCPSGTPGSSTAARCPGLHETLDLVETPRINRHLDDTLWLRRAHSVGYHRQLLNLIMYALGVNGLSMQVQRQGLAPPAAA